MSGEHDSWRGSAAPRQKPVNVVEIVDFDLSETERAKLGSDVLRTGRFGEGGRGDLLDGYRLIDRPRGEISEGFPVECAI